MRIQLILSFVAFLCLLTACDNKGQQANKEPETNKYQRVSPDFNADNAYNFVSKQVNFGPRVPNSQAHINCGDYLVSELKNFGAEVIEQKAVLTAYDGTQLNARNIIGSYNTDKSTRILLFAHWDSRPFADQDNNKAKRTQPVLGANDGASGVAVLLEIGRVLQSKMPEVGVDIIFFDAEDYGAYSETESWCLGSQYWAKNPHTPDYSAKYGILLDMVGAKNARFSKEEYSMHYAPSTVEKVWSTASRLKYGHFFPNAKGGAITDDHVPVNEVRKIPSINIIHKTEDESFFEHWHTTRDDMSNISPETMKAVGQTLLEVIYTEKGE